jgi:hypothetical protein
MQVTAGAAATGPGVPQVPVLTRGLTEFIYGNQAVIARPPINYANGP